MVASTQIRPGALHSNFVLLYSVYLLLHVVSDIYLSDRLWQWLTTSSWVKAVTPFKRFVRKKGMQVASLKKPLLSGLLCDSVESGGRWGEGERAQERGLGDTALSADVDGGGGVWRKWWCSHTGRREDKTYTPTNNFEEISSNLN